MSSNVVEATRETHLQAGIRLHRAGDRPGAERRYTQALAENPNDAVAAFLRGVLALEAKQHDFAAEMFVRATSLAPDNAVYHSNLGEAERRRKRYGSAATSLLRAMALKPDLAAPVYNLGLLLDEVNDPNGAVACFERAAQLQPGIAGIEERIADTRARQRPDSSSAVSMTEFAHALARQDRVPEAIALARMAVEMNPQLVDGHWTLGTVLFNEGLFDEAIACFRRTLELNPKLSSVRGNLASALSRCGRVDEGIAVFRETLAQQPDDPVQRSNLLFAMHFSPSCDARAILDEARAWDERLRPLQASGPGNHSNDRSPERRLRIGYVSPDFRNHCQAFFLFPLLANHDREKFEVFCYSDVRQPDEITSALLKHADRWRTIVGLSDADLATAVREDGIDVLVDLTMHMAENRLLAFARKPAPVQVSWLAYPGTTGLSAIDYRLSDPHLDPPDGDLTVYSERTLHLPDTFWCYSPLVSYEGDNPLPARETGRVRFGSLNNFCKVNDSVIALWAKVLHRVADSSLVAMVPVGESSTRTLAEFARHGIGPERLELVPKVSRLSYLARYKSIDVVLDTFPYNGHTTSLDALWMGVPVVTLVGPTVVGRAGLSQAMNLGMPELVARTPDEYVAIAAELAGDLDKLATLRAALPSRMEKSPLMDGARFARGMETAFRMAWRRWCSEP